MRRCLVFLTLLILFCPPISQAAEVMVGEVISVDREKGEVEIRPLGDEGGDERKPTVKIQLSPEQLRGYVRQGAKIRVWEGVDAGGRTTTAISPLRGSGPAGAGFSPTDPTGVRSRLMRGAGAMPGRGPGGRGRR